MLGKVPYLSLFFILAFIASGNMSLWADPADDSSNAPNSNTPTVVAGRSGVPDLGDLPSISQKMANETSKIEQLKSSGFTQDPQNAGKILTLQSQYNDQSKRFADIAAQERDSRAQEAAIGQ